MPRQSLRQFLLLGKSTIQTAIRESQKINFVIGNESADLDSLASSILFAYVCSFVPRPSWRPGTAYTLYIPILNIPSADLRLRPEFQALLPHTDVAPSDLITLDDLPPVSELPRKLKPENTKWILVDHNALQGRLGEIYGSRVQGVIDHHEDEHVVPMDTGDEPRIVENSGSCTSLVTEYCRNDWDRLSESEWELAQLGVMANVADKRGWDAQLAKLALAAILIDTTNMTSSKTTPHDENAVEYLTKKLAKSLSHAIGYRPAEYYQEIRQAKEAMDDLELGDILRKDYKEWTEKNQKKLGISSVVKSLSWQIDHAESQSAPGAEGKYGNVFWDSIFAHAESRNLSIFTIMTTFRDSEGKHRREMLIWVLDPDCIATLKEITHTGKEELALEPWRERHLVIPEAERDRIRVWRLNKVSKSRKQVAPLLRQCMNRAS